MSQKRKDLPSVTSGAFQQRLRETVQTYLGRMGDPLDRGITVRDLIDADLVRLRYPLQNGSGPVPIEPAPGLGGDTYEPDLTEPPQPTLFTATPAISHILIEHEPPFYTQGHGHLLTRVYGAIVEPGDPLPTFTDAVEVAQFTGTVYAMASNPNTRWRLWIKWQSVDGVLSATPAGGANGIEALTGQDVSSLVEAMTGPGNPFVILTEETEIDGVLFPAGTYSAQAFVRDLQVTRAKIADLAVDDAKVANLSVSKLIAGSIAVGEHIQSTGYVPTSAGWRINGNGTAEFSGVVVRGTIYASAGQIGGSTIGATYMRSTSYVLGEAGWNFNSDGTGQVGGITMLNDALQSNNFVAGTTGWRLRSDGSIEASSGVFRGALSGSTISASMFLTGAFTGYAWPPAGVGNVGAYLGPSGLLIGNANNGRYFQVAANGDISAPGFSVSGGVLTISQANVVNALNIANNAVSVSNFASGNQAASTNITIPAGVTASVFAIVIKASSSTTTALIPDASMSLNIGGSVFSQTVYRQQGGDGSEGGGGSFFFYPSASLAGLVNFSGGVTVTASASFSGTGVSNGMYILLFARWK